MTALDRRLTRLRAALPPPPAPPREVDYSRLNPEQRARWTELGECFATVGLPGLTDAELVEIADLLSILEREGGP